MWPKSRFHEETRFREEVAAAGSEVFPRIICFLRYLHHQKPTDGSGAKVIVFRFTYTNRMHLNCITGIKTITHMGSGGCGAVGRTIVSNIRDTWFESSHRQFYFVSSVLNELYRKD